MSGGGMIATLSREVVSDTTRGEPLWFHPRACAVPRPDSAPPLGDSRIDHRPAIPDQGSLLVMTAQGISGSDVFGPVHWMTSADGGRTWSEARPVPGFGRRSLPDGMEEGVCDAVPEYHAPTGRVLVLGFNVYYRDDVLARPNEDRHVPYAVFDPATGSWSGRQRLAWDDPLASAIYTSNCSQRVTLDASDGVRAGDVIVPLSFGPRGRRDRFAATVRCTFDGAELRVAERGSLHELAVRRGLLEPSVCRVGGAFFLTVRAEDGRGYVSRSGDGLDWQPLAPWCWDDGEPIAMSTTQQRWLPHSDALYLVYTRRSEDNRSVMRWRSPLWLAEVDRARLCLLRATERVVFPLKGDGIGDPEGVPLMGNFHTTAISPAESIVTVGENLPGSGYRGRTLLARITWRRPNRQAIA